VNLRETEVMHRELKGRLNPRPRARGRPRLFHAAGPIPAVLSSIVGGSRRIRSPQMRMHRGELPACSMPAWRTRSSAKPSPPTRRLESAHAR